MGSTGLEPLAEVRTQGDMLDALRTARVMRNLSNEVCDDRCGLTRGHVDKCLGPTAAKKLSGMMFDVLTAFFAIKFVMVRDLEAEAQMAAKWQGRDTSNVRVSQNRMGKYFLDRARPALQEQLQQQVLQDFGAKLALAFGDEVGQLLTAAMATRAEPEPVPSIESSPALLALPPPDPTPPEPPESPLSAKVEAFKPRQSEQPVSRSHLRVVQFRKGVRLFGGTL
jgi:hypothetical protein